MLLHAAMPHIAPVILKRRGGFSGTSKRPPLWVLGPETAMGTAIMVYVHLEQGLGLRLRLRIRVVEARALRALWLGMQIVRRRPDLTCP